MTWVIAHRGASADAPDNSLEAFELAIAAGADLLEFDVRRTRDGVLVASHDPVPDAAGVARLDDVLALARGRVGLDVELKEDGYVEEACAALSAGFDAEALVVTSFLDGVVGQVGRYLPGARTGLLFARGRALVDRLWRCGADYAAPHVVLARRGALKRAAAAGYPSLVWTVNREADLRAFVADERVAGVITDVPALAVAVRTDRP